MLSNQRVISLDAKAENAGRTVNTCWVRHLAGVPSLRPTENIGLKIVPEDAYQRNDIVDEVEHVKGGHRMYASSCNKYNTGVYVT